MDPIKGQTTPSASVLAQLRQHIANGRYPPGARLAEIPVALALGVSRTPVRLAFRTLEQEGLLQKSGKRGLVVRAFTDDDVRCAIDVRGALEGLAARRLAERGPDADTLATLRRCLDEGDQVLASGLLDASHVDRWSRLNAEFHGTLVQAGGGRVVADAIARNDHLPFASADSIAIDLAHPGRELRKLRTAQLQHRLMVDALQRRESARVEQLMREHALVGFRYGGVLDPATDAPG